MKKIPLLIALLSFTLPSIARTNGGIDAGMLSVIEKSYTSGPAERMVRNALNSTDINALAVNADNAAMIDTHFSDEVATKGRTDQKRSGRCWLFTGLNILRAEAISRHNLGEFQFSQAYCFFWDQLEKSNLFLQRVIDTRDRSMDDREVDWLFQHPVSDGGTFTGVANLVMKYGVVPSDVMPESRIANNTAQFAARLRILLRQYGLELRRNHEGVKGRDVEEALHRKKTEMLCEVYRLLALAYGVPPKEFDWKGKTYTPVQFYREMVGFDLEKDYVMLMNDPSREYGKVYEIDLDRHVYDGDNWRYVNLPMDRIKEMAIASIKGGEAMYFGCDVSKFLDRQKGVADLENFDFDALLGVKTTMDKRERILTHTSGSSHAMTLIAVDVKDGKPVKWMVENSWGKSFGYKGNIIMTDKWLDEYMFRLVVNRKYVPADVLEMERQKPVRLPCWDPMFLGEE